MKLRAGAGVDGGVGVRGMDCSGGRWKRRAKEIMNYLLAMYRANQRCDGEYNGSVLDPFLIW